jgi:hypothetical protein
LVPIRWRLSSAGGEERGSNAALIATGTLTMML